MCEATQCGQGMGQYLVRRLVRDARNKANAAGIMMKTGIKEGRARQGRL
jgi:hypothetical protein